MGQEVLNTDLYCLTAEDYSLGRSNIEVADKMLEAGIEIIQYRAKKKKKFYKYEECLKLRKMTNQAEAKLIVNDDVDLALAIDADGVHIGQEDLPIEEVRNLVGPDKIIGLSTHSPQQARDAQNRGADYIGVGPIFKTDTKEDVCNPVGLKYLDYVVENIDLPCVAIGGIKENNVDLVKDMGAKCISMVTEIVGAKNIIDKIKSIRAKIRPVST